MENRFFIKTLLGVFFGFFLFPVPFSFSREISVVSGEKVRSIGSGYNSQTEELLGPCVEAEEEVTRSEGTLRIAQEVDERTTSALLGFEAGGRGRMGLLSVSAATQYFNESKASALSVSLNYFSEYLKTSSIKALTVKPIQKVEAYLENPPVWFDRCGDEYVYSRDEGARLMVNLRVDFVSQEEKSRFAAQIALSGGFMEMRAKIEKVQQSMSRQTKLTLSVLQLGGDPAQLGSIFRSSSGQGETRQVMSCSFGELSQCMEVMANIIDYGTNQEMGFPSQIKHFSNYSVLKIRTQPWRFLAALGAPRPPSEELLLAAEVNRKELQGLFEEYYQLWLQASRHLKTNIPRLSEASPERGRGQREKMKEVEDQLRAHLDHIGRQLERCYDNPGRCQTFVETVNRDLGSRDQRINQRTLAELLTPETYTQFCDLRKTSPALDQTIKALDAVAFENSGFKSREDWEKEDSCALGEKELRKLRKLDLSRLSIEDLRPIGTLLQLEELNLSENHVVNVAPLSSLQRLVQLNLGHNRIVDISPLATLTSLRSLNLQGNGILDVQPLEALGGLTNLDLRGNRVELKECRLLHQPFCKLRDLSKNAKFIEIHTSGIPFQQCCGMSVCAEEKLQQVLFTGGTTDQADQNTFSFVFDSETQGLLRCGELKVPRSGHSSTLLKDGDSVLLVGGDRIDGTLEVYSLSQKSSLYAASLKSPRMGHTATLLENGQVVIAGGWRQGLLPAFNRNDAVPTLELFDPNLKAVRTLGKGLAPARAHHAAVLLGSDRLLFTGGVNGTDVFNTVEFLENRAGEFLVTKPRGLRLKTPRFYHTMTVLPDGKVLIAGGFGAQLEALSSAELYDPRENRLVSLDRGLETPRGGHAAVLVENRWVLFVGGAQAYTGGLLSRDPRQKALIQTEVFDLETRSFIPVGSLKHPRVFPSLGVLQSEQGSRVFVGPCMGSDFSQKTFECLEVNDLYE